VKLVIDEIHKVCKAVLLCMSECPRPGFRGGGFWFFDNRSTVGRAKALNGRCPGSAVATRRDSLTMLTRGMNSTATGMRSLRDPVKVPRPIGPACLRTLNRNVQAPGNQRTHISVHGKPGQGQSRSQTDHEGWGRIRFRKNPEEFGAESR